jgi:hypothetical protein
MSVLSASICGSKPPLAKTPLYGELTIWFSVPTCTWHASCHCNGTVYQTSDPSLVKTLEMIDGFMKRKFSGGKSVDETTST